MQYITKTVDIKIATNLHEIIVSAVGANPVDKYIENSAAVYTALTLVNSPIFEKFTNDNTYPIEDTKIELSIQLEQDIANYLQEWADNNNMSFSEVIEKAVALDIGMTVQDPLEHVIFSDKCMELTAMYFIEIKKELDEIDGGIENEGINVSA